MTLCWICGDTADTAEHFLKASDVRLVFGKGTIRTFIHKENDRPHIIQGAKSDLLKFSENICTTCNSGRTQRHDTAWERLSKWMRQNPTVLSPGRHLNFKGAFGSEVHSEGINLHLYFLKLLGCLAATHSVNLPLNLMGLCILSGIPYPDMYMQFYAYPTNSPQELAINEFTVLGTKTVPIAAIWSYRVGIFAVGLKFINLSTSADGQKLGWHPQINPKSPKLRGEA